MSLARHGRRSRSSRRRWPGHMPTHWPSEEGWPTGIRITANSTSVRAFEQPLREAAATARAMLIGAAADRWNVDPSTCDTADGFVINGGRTVTFGELAEEAADRTPADECAAAQTGKSRLLGSRCNGSTARPRLKAVWRFAADVRLPGMLFASARLAPPGGRLGAFCARCGRDHAGHPPRRGARRLDRCRCGQLVGGGAGVESRQPDLLRRSNGCRSTVAV